MQVMHVGELTSGTYVCVSVRDTGPGISEELQEKIFEPFYTTKNVSKGTGLGMSVSFDVIQAHNGSISIISQLSNGSTITLRLPIK